MTEVQKSPFVTTVSSLILGLPQPLDKQPAADPFPLRVRIADVPKSALTSLKLYLAEKKLEWKAQPDAYDVFFHDKRSTVDVVKFLLKNHTLSFDYSGFVSHPGTLFVRGLLKKETLPDQLQEFFNKHSPYASMKDVNILGASPDDLSDEVSAILKFDNFLDVDHVLEHMPLSPNPFHQSAPLYINRYMSKKERSILQNEQASALSSSNESNDLHEDSVIYDAMIIENLSDFLPGAVTLDVVQNVLSKFLLFHNIDKIWLPVAEQEDDKVRFRRVGYIGFAHGKATSVDLLRCLYHMNNLSLQEVLDFSSLDIYDILRDVNQTEPPQKPLDALRLKLSIAQRKHNHHLFECGESPYLGVDDVLKSAKKPSIRITEAASMAATNENAIINRFLKGSNYQETNVYVNNFPIIFENNDALWHEFWNQFGVDRIKSAKIIKPQFYSKKADDATGKIGFVFYEEFKMALRAIILTNNKVIWYDNYPNVLIRASFAIQKNSHSQSGPKNVPPKFHHSNSLPNHNFFPSHDGSFAKRVSLGGDPNYYLLDQRSSPPPSPQFIPHPDAYMFSPYMMPIAAYPPRAGEERASDESSPSASPNHSIENVNSQPVLGNSYPPPYGYYFSYFPYQGQMPMNGPVQPMPMNGLMPMTNQTATAPFKETPVPRERKEKKKQ